MWNTIIAILAWTYAVVAFLLGVYSTNFLILTTIYWIKRLRGKRDIQKLPADFKDWPVVTIQLPLFNEQQVARRLIDAIARLDYPLDRLHIQVLDDSTDDTVELVSRSVEYWKERGRWITYIHRDDRKDFKAGALKEGLKSSNAEFVAIFDADFIPPRDWLKRTLPPLLLPGSEKIGLVQTRWSHLNDNYSLLTRAQALMLDGHFGIDQDVRCYSGLFLNFNGTAGIWRRAAIEDAGNWRGSTLSEDMDLSFRAQLRGWKIHYMVDVTAPAEVPTLMVGFKRQQFRWTKGSIQVVKLMGPSILRARISVWKKIQGLIHLTSYMTHPLMIIFLVLTLPLNLWGLDVVRKLPLGWLGIVGFGPPLYFATSQIALYKPRQGLRWFARMPLLAMLGVGIAANNTKAILEGLWGTPSAFERTPKTGVIHRTRNRYEGVHETLKIDGNTWIEVILCLYAIVLAVMAIQSLNWVGAFFFLLYATGFGWVAGETIWEAQGTRSRRAEEEPSIS